MRRSLAISMTSVVVILATGSGLTAQSKDEKKAKPFVRSERFKVKTLNDYFPFHPPTTKAEWLKRREKIRNQVLVATGLWPMPPKTPLKPVIHGKIKGDGYTIENVFFESYPGFYVTGNLYRPTKKADERIPGILCPHGHWPNGRFYDGKARAEQQIAKGAEKTVDGARSPLQARCVQLARMGCVAFLYDMVGYADSTQITHRKGFTDPEALLRLQNFMGLQTWNSIRALDFLLSLPEVDPKRIGVTGSSGGGTQTFMICAVDDRPAVAFPAVMVSTAMQGGCICENCSYLRVGTGNIELAALFAPKPLAMSGADDWTIEIEKKGLPELKAVYKLYGAADEVNAEAFPQFKHNYNQVAREMMYNWFNKYLKLGQKTPVKEQPFPFVPSKELSVFDEKHPRPKNAANIEVLRRYMTAQSDKQLQSMFPKDAKSLKKFRKILGVALQSMMNDDPLSPATKVKEVAAKKIRPKEGLVRSYVLVTREGQQEEIPLDIIRGKDFDGTYVVWVHPEGTQSLWGKDGKLVAAAQHIVDNKYGIIAVDVFGVGRQKLSERSIDMRYAGYTFGYNRPLVANRVQDILTTITYAKGLQGTKKVQLIGFGEAGPWVVLAGGLTNGQVDRIVADMDQFRFETILTVENEMMLPGALKYGGLPVLSALVAPTDLYLHNLQGTGTNRWRTAAYRIDRKSNRLHEKMGQAAPEKAVEWLTK